MQKLSSNLNDQVCIRILERQGGIDRKMYFLRGYVQVSVKRHATDAARALLPLIDAVFSGFGVPQHRSLTPVTPLREVSAG